VEKANDIFKQQLYTCQAECNTIEWVQFLPEIAMVVNSTQPSSLPAQITPFEVFFSRKPHWLTAPLLDVDNDPVDEHGNVLSQDEPDSDNEYKETNTEAAEFILTELERSIRQSNAQTAARIVKKAGGKVKVYTKGSIVSLGIPLKWRLQTEAKRLLCWISKVAKNKYTLICSVGPLSGTHHAGQLNSVLSPDESSLPLRFPAKADKLTINKVRALFY
jgi:hypothetical protein